MQKGYHYPTLRTQQWESWSWFWKRKKEALYSHPYPLIAKIIYYPVYLVIFILSYFIKKNDRPDWIPRYHGYTKKQLDKMAVADRVDYMKTVEYLRSLSEKEKDEYIDLIIENETGRERVLQVKVAEQQKLLKQKQHSDRTFHHRIEAGFYDEIEL